MADELLELRLSKSSQLVKLPELLDGDRVAGLAKFGWFGEWCLAGVVVGQRVAEWRQCLGRFPTVYLLAEYPGIRRHATVGNPLEQGNEQHRPVNDVVAGPHLVMNLFVV